MRRPVRHRNRPRRWVRRTGEPLPERGERKRSDGGRRFKLRMFGQQSKKAGVPHVVFDLLYEGYQPLLDQPLSQRRRRLAQLVADLGRPQLAFSDGIVGAGRALFDEVCRLGLEGLVAKRLTSRYRPGKRTRDWIKIKPPGPR
jgi:ATP-dependent DNA ligase